MSGRARAGLGTGRRRALLAGITGTPGLTRTPAFAEHFPPLPFVDRDVDRLREVLERSGYEVTAYHSGHTDPDRREVTRNNLHGWLDAFFASCEPGDTALVYLSGHGVLLQNRDFLVPADAKPDLGSPVGAPAPNRNTLLGADPMDLLDRRVKEGVTVAVLLDMCRTEGWSEEPPRKVLSEAQNAFWLYSSGAGRPSYGEPSAGSFFARALAESLSPDTPPQTFHAIAAHTQTVLWRLFAGRPEEPPTVQSVGDHLPDAAADLVEWCEGSRRTSRWTEAVRESELWRHTSHPELHEQVLGRLELLVEAVVGLGAGTAARGEDPWGDPEHPGQVAERVTTWLGRLVEWAGLREAELLSPAETAMLLAAPVLHEGVLTVVLHDLRTVFGPDLGAPVTALLAGRLARVQADAVDVLRAHAPVKRAAESLRARGLDDAARAADHWLRHRFVADWDLPWEPGDPGSGPGGRDRSPDYPEVDLLIGLATDAVCCIGDTRGTGTGTGVGTGTGTGTGTSTRDTVTYGTYDTYGTGAAEVRRMVGLQIRQVAGHLTVGPADSPRINNADADTRRGWTDYPPLPGTRWRGRPMSQLLHTAGLLAADPRRMSGVLVEHLAARSALRPGEVLASLSQLLGFARSATDGRLGFHFPGCPHPALHSAVEELAEQADHAVRALHKEEHNSPLLRGIPTRVAADRIVPEGRKYRVPLERLRLAEDEIRPLLMGTQLYGDRMLAVRELYQNALDACRYRSMRVAYRMRGAPHPWWRPRIAFVQDVDEEGRPYIECTDSGTGMNEERLVSMFARAGKRYEQDARFVQELRNWRRAKVKVTALNSRFGIGVFSYFMLAEEIVVWSTPVDLYGDPLSRDSIQAEIQAGSGLIQFRSPDPGLLPTGGGTRVRLYLTERNAPAPSLIETLREHLRVSDHKVVARGPDGDGLPAVATWEPGVLQPSEDWTDPPWRLTEDIWLVQGEGQLLLDGVLVANASNPYGYVVSLRERHRPEPSVDRKQLHAYDESLVMAEMLAAVPRQKPGWETVLMPSLWRLVHSEPRLAVLVVRSLLPTATAATVGWWAREGPKRLPTVPLSTLGCLPLDNEDGTDWIISLSGSDHRYENRVLTRWRQGWMRRAYGPDEPFRPSGYPAPEALDALLFRTSPAGCSTALQAAYDAGVSVGRTLRALRRYAVVGIRVPTVADLRALRELRPHALMAELYDNYVETASLNEHSLKGGLALHVPLLHLSNDRNLSLGEACSLLRQLLPVDPDLPAPPELDPSVADSPIHSGDSSWDPTGSPTGVLSLPGTVTVAEFLVTPAPAELVRHVRRWEAFGITLPPGLGPEAVAHAPLSERVRRILSEDRDAMAPWIRRAPDLYDLVYASAEFQDPLGDIADEVRTALAGTGWDVPAVPDEAIGWTAPSWVQPLIPKPADTRHPVSPTWITLHPPWGPESDTDVPERVAALRMLALCGILSDDSPRDWPRLAEGARHQAVSLLPVRNFLERSWTDALGGRIPFAAMVAFSVSHHATLEESAALFDRAADTFFLRVPALPEGTGGLTPTEDEQEALTGGAGFGFADSLPVVRLLAYAERMQRPLPTCIDLLSAYTPLGAPPPPGDFTGPDADRLADFVPDDFDLAAFDTGLLGPGTLGPLELVLVAGRFGRTLGETYARYAPFRCLGLDVTVRRPTSQEASLVPDWRDVVLLTTGLTGRAPALTGPVDPDHIRLCHEETDLDVDGVRARLASYAALFSFQLPPPEGQSA
ncbi:caspase family protein [Streptomyces sp. NPDC021093]|uniref:HD domain-containing protein n=1 Tax=Streptomyces sp. NPDC021093 TaxID=3365112 RepID=UPI00378C631D